ncbi:TPA: 23S rRNA methyltransferase attenuation leader peptide [Streptococcus agalactiae]|nr:23S rRNA methyltransferase attenuation leader peptide [Streptococcus agalactiae]
MLVFQMRNVDKTSGSVAKF